MTPVAWRNSVRYLVCGEISLANGNARCWVHSVPDRYDIQSRAPRTSFTRMAAWSAWLFLTMLLSSLAIVTMASRCVPGFLGVKGWLLKCMAIGLGFCQGSSGRVLTGPLCVTSDMVREPQRGGELRGGEQKILRRNDYIPEIVWNHVS